MRGVRVETGGEPAARVVWVETPRLRLRVDAARLRVDLSSAAGATALGGLVPDAAGLDVAARLADPGTMRSLGIGEVKARAGDALRIELQAAARGGAGVRLRVEVPEEAAGVSLALALENRGEQALRVRDLGFRLDPASARTSAPPRIERVLGLRHDDPLRVRMPLAPPGPPAGSLRDALVVLSGPAAPALLAGFTTADRAQARVEAELRAGTLARLRLASDAGAQALAPGSVVESERAWIALGGDPGALLADWAKRLSAEMEARAPARGYGVWSTRLALARGARLPDALRPHLAVLAGLPGRIAVELDDRFAAASGDWLDPTPALPAGLRRVAEAIAENGLVPGLALAPFLASRSSRLLRAHPEAALRGPRGRRIAARVDPYRPGGLAWALDPTHPAVRAFLRETFAGLRELGFAHFALEALRAGLFEGVRHDPRPSAVEAYREALAEIRAAAGEDTHLDGADAPISPSVGRLDGLRFGEARPGRWRASRLARSRLRPPHLRTTSAARNAAAVLDRAFAAQRLGLLDPGAVRVGAPELSRAEAQTLLSLAGLGAGVVHCADDLAALDAERRDWLRRALPPLSREVVAPSPQRRRGPRLLLAPLLGRRLAVVAVNPSDRPTPIRVTLAELGREGPHHVFDFWEARHLGVTDREIAPRLVPAHGCRVLGLTPLSDRAQVVGSTLHLGMGTLEVAALRSEPDGAHRLVLRLPGEHAGAVWIAPARAREARRVPVAFRDAGTFFVRIGRGVGGYAPSSSSTARSSSGSTGASGGVSSPAGGRVRS